MNKSTWLFIFHLDEVCWFGNINLCLAIGKSELTFSCIVPGHHGNLAKVDTSKQSKEDVIYSVVLSSYYSVRIIRVA